MCTSHVFDCFFFVVFFLQKGKFFIVAMDSGFRTIYRNCLGIYFLQCYIGISTIFKLVPENEATISRI